MYSLNRYFDIVNTTTIVIAIIAVSFIGTYFINVLRHKADKPSKFGCVIYILFLERYPQIMDR